eukprot:g10995.t1
MAGNRARGLGYGSLPGPPIEDEHLAHTGGPTPSEVRQQQHGSWLRVGIASIAVVASLGLLSASRFTASPGGSFGLEAGISNEAAGAAYGDAPQFTETPGASVVGSEGDEDLLSFVASNEYTRRGDVVGRGYPWLQDRILVEPFRRTTLAVVSPKEGMVYSWRITATDPEIDAQEGMQIAYTGQAVEVVFERAPKYTVVVEERSGDGAGEDGVDVTNDGGAGGGTVVRSTNVEVFCKYVRREIRSLFDEERDQMFDAMKVLWDVGMEEGRDLYGPDYMDVWTIDKFHQIGASDIECDHLHDGIGFGVTHSMVTMMFENSLQLVNPMISLPYWDFTIEGSVIDTDEEFAGDYTRLVEASPLWTPDWFGGVDREDYQVKDGRWGYMPVPVVDEDERLTVGADVYGRMRSPWNVNDRPFMTRGLGEMCGLDSTEFYSWPGCSSHYDLQNRFNSYYGYTWWSQYGPHGPVHVWVGGNVDCKKDMDTVIDIVGEEYRQSMSGFLFVFRKDMFRDTAFKCRGYVEPQVSEEEIMKSGTCGCLDFDLTEASDDYKMVFENFSQFYTFDKDFTEEEQRILAVQWCNGQVGMGESSQSSSPVDPTFWSMHPTMERLLVFKLLAGTFTDYSWPDEAGSWVGMDGTEYDVEISTRSDTCVGHRGSDIFPYGILTDFITPQFTFYGKKAPNTLRNRMLVKLFDPSENALPFIYDNFEWSHCADMGYDFSDFFDTETMKSGPKGTAASKEEKEKTTRVDGFELFEKGFSHRAPGFDPPSVIKKIEAERNEEWQQKLKEMKKKKKNA